MHLKIIQNITAQEYFGFTNILRGQYWNFDKARKFVRNLNLKVQLNIKIGVTVNSINSRKNQFIYLDHQVKFIKKMAGLDGLTLLDLKIQDHLKRKNFLLMKLENLLEN